MRAFLALPLPPDTATALLRLQEGFSFGKPVPEENLHLTLAFLGDVSETELADIDMALGGLGWPSFDVAFEGLDSFTEMDRGLIFAAVRHSDALDGLQAKITRLVRAAGIALPRRRFRPHVTLIRANRRPRGMDRDRIAAQLGARAEMPGFRAEAVVLYGSTLTPGGAIHEALARYPLADPLA
ncbi:RNA 2',3'-cyclic phosphodiesterase [Roseicyclus elongatus]|uniref:RNA 2',3'-cyclic phosphodiesterase n=1 Tax=Roseicyclus elongatus TaxID=159346 RepID=UPI00046D404C|nr:RNA 2',3'-cyclic phosphodiesterase [Roseibacterium elongatum]